MRPFSRLLEKLLFVYLAIYFQNNAPQLSTTILYRMTMDKNKIERCTCMLIIQNKKQFSEESTPRHALIFRKQYNSLNRMGHGTLFYTKTISLRQHRKSNLWYFFPSLHSVTFTIVCISVCMYMCVPLHFSKSTINVQRSIRYSYLSVIITFLPVKSRFKLVNVTLYEFINLLNNHSV